MKIVYIILAILLGIVWSMIIMRGYKADEPIGKRMILSLLPLLLLIIPEETKKIRLLISLIGIVSFLYSFVIQEERNIKKML